MESSNSWVALRRSSENGVVVSGLHAPVLSSDTYSPPQLLGPASTRERGARGVMYRVMASINYCGVLHLVTHTRSYLRDLRRFFQVYPSACDGCALTPPPPDLGLLNSVAPNDHRGRSPASFPYRYSTASFAICPRKVTYSDRHIFSHRTFILRHPAPLFCNTFFPFRSIVLEYGTSHNFPLVRMVFDFISIRFGSKPF